MSQHIWNTVSEHREVRNLTTTSFLLHLKEAAKDNSSMSGKSSCDKENMDLEWESKSNEDEDEWLFVGVFPWHTTLTQPNLYSY